MILHPLPSRLLVVNQIDHAAFAAEVLSLWRTDGLPEHPRRQALLRGTREHDNGWAEADSAPRRRDDGRPHDFRSIPRDVRLDIFQRGVQRSVQGKPKKDQDPEAWVYVVRHALELHRDDDRGDGGTDDWAEDWQKALAEWQELEDELRELIGLAEDELASDYRYLWIADSLSLAACLRWSEPRTVRGTTMWVTEEDGKDGKPEEMPDELTVTLHLDPFPLAGATTFKMRCRLIPDRAYTGDADLAVELAMASWVDLTVRVAR